MNVDIDSILLFVNAIVLLTVIIAPIIFVGCHVCESTEDTSRIGCVMIVLFAVAIGAIIVKKTIMEGKGWAAYYQWLLCGETLTVLLAASIVDAKTRRIPNVLPLMVIGLKIFISICQWLNQLETWKQFGFDLLCGIVCIVLLLLVSKISHEGIGMGDIKLLASLGFACGMEMLWSTVLFALLFCVVAAIVLLVKKKKTMKDSLPFAPFILTGYVGTLLLMVL